MRKDLSIFRKSRPGLCAAGNKRYFEVYQGADRTADAVSPCPTCTRPVKLRVTSWGVVLVPPHYPLDKVSTTE